MFILLIRTIIIYIFLLITMRLMGKRQLGELEISELVSTLLLSDIAALPITNQEIPITYAIVPILAITTFEVCSSLFLTKFPRLKGLFSTRPSMVIRKGKIDNRELLKNRISLDELMSELRQKDVTDIDEVNYAIVEQNGKMTVIKKERFSPPTRDDMGITVAPSGLCHIVVADGVINRFGLQLIQKDEAWLSALLKKEKTSLHDVYLLTANDNDEIRLITRSQVLHAQGETS